MYQSIGLQSTEDIQTLQQRPATRFPPLPYWVKLDPAVQREKCSPCVRKFAEAVRERLRRAGKLDKALKEVERLRSEYTEEVMARCNSVQHQLVEESKPLAKEYATPNPENVAHLPELSSQQEQAKLPEGFVSNPNSIAHHNSDTSRRRRSTPSKYSYSYHGGRLLTGTTQYNILLSNNASQEFTKFYYNAVKPLPSEKEITANGLRYMNDEAFMAFNYYTAEKDLYEGLDCKFGELLHHCFIFEEYWKVYSHYNFTIEMKRKMSSVGPQGFILLKLSGCVG